MSTEYENAVHEALSAKQIEFKPEDFYKTSPIAAKPKIKVLLEIYPNPKWHCTAFVEVDEADLLSLEAEVKAWCDRNQVDDSYLTWTWSMYE